jgi:hypothetical protein
MGKLFEQVGETVGAFIHHPIVQALTTALTVYVVIVWLATAYWAFQDLRRRDLNPGLPYLAAAGIIVASPILFPLALVVYRIVRPGETLFEARERELSDRLELLTAEADLVCTGCGLRTEDDWLACPACRTRLGHQCAACGRVMGLDWTLCAWCAAEFGRAGRSLPVPPAELAAVAASDASSDLAGSIEPVSPADEPRPNGVERLSGGRRERRVRPEAARV